MLSPTTLSKVLVFLVIAALVAIIALASALMYRENGREFQTTIGYEGE
jgi:hypothetical protein